MKPLVNPISTSLSHQQSMRYARHVMLPALDFIGQERILAARVLIVGVGGLGCAVAPYLASSGVGTLYLADHDSIDESNLQRQILFRESDVGANKAETAASALQQLNSSIQIHAITQKITATKVVELLTHVDLIIDCSDNLTTRNLLNEACFQAKKPLISGAAIRMEGQISVFPMQPSTPCYQCYSHLIGDQQLSCMEAGVLAPVVGVIGTMQAVEALKIITGVGESLAGTLLLYDAANASWQRLTLPKRSHCPVCG